MRIDLRYVIPLGIVFGPVLALKAIFWVAGAPVDDVTAGVISVISSVVSALVGVTLGALMISGKLPSLWVRLPWGRR